uniref:Uncharacterized protein n=1 Tax=Cyprinus carpio TaxID=7962 RepID=A0A8C2HUX9_CYPCA
MAFFRNSSDNRVVSATKPFRYIFQLELRMCKCKVHWTPMNITYYSVLVMDKHRFDISNDLFPALEFIHKALTAPAHFFLAYLMIHHEILLEDAIDHVIDMRWIRPNRDFLKQLTILNSNLKSHGKIRTT